MTVATDSAEMYHSDYPMICRNISTISLIQWLRRKYMGDICWVLQHDHLQELSYYDKKRIFNLGYYTWVEQQNIPVEEFNKREDPKFWKNLRSEIKEWDEKIKNFNRQVVIRLNHRIINTTHSK